MRVCLCRPRPESLAVARDLKARNIATVIAPVIAIELLPAVLPKEPVDCLVMTSMHALTALSDEQRMTLRALPVLAVGPATAAAARDVGFSDVRIAAGDSEALRDLLRLTQPRPARIVYLAGRVRKPRLTDALLTDGHTINIVETYDARPIPWDEAIVRDLRNSPPDAWLHFSRRSAELAAAAAQTSGLWTSMESALHLCLSDDVAAPLRATGLNRLVVAAQPRTASLLAALERATQP